MQALAVVQTLDALQKGLSSARRGATGTRTGSTGLYHSHGEHIAVALNESEPRPSGIGKGTQPLRRRDWPRTAPVPSPPPGGASITAPAASRPGFRHQGPPFAPEQDHRLAPGRGHELPSRPRRPSHLRSQKSLREVPNVTADVHLRPAAPGSALLGPEMGTGNLGTSAAPNVPMPFTQIRTTGAAGRCHP